MSGSGQLGDCIDIAHAFIVEVNPAILGIPTVLRQRGVSVFRERVPDDQDLPAPWLDTIEGCIHRLVRSARFLDQSPFCRNIDQHLHPARAIERRNLVLEPVLQVDQAADGGEQRNAGRSGQQDNLLACLAAHRGAFDPVEAGQRDQIDQRNKRQL